MLNRYINHKFELPEYNPTADFDWIKTKSGLPWLKLEIDIPYQAILAEISNIQSLLQEHREEYGEHQGWKSFCIHGKSYDATREDSYYNDSRPCIWTPEATKLMPNTVDYFSTQWPSVSFNRVRVMLLEPGGYVSIHRDTDHAELTAINIAITQPADCNFVMEKHGTVPFEPGSAFWLDISNRHTVFNDSSEHRWHIIIHQDFDNIEFQNMVVNSYKKLYNTINENRYNHNQR